MRTIAQRGLPGTKKLSQNSYGAHLGDGSRAIFLLFWPRRARILLWARSPARCYTACRDLYSQIRVSVSVMLVVTEAWGSSTRKLRDQLPAGPDLEP